MDALTRRGFAQAALAASIALAARDAYGEEPRNWLSGFTTPPEHFGGALTRIHGRLPPGLSGVLYRAGPAQFERAGERLGHWFDGDGMVQAFHIGDGTVTHRGRFVATDKRRLESAAGRFLYAGYGFAPRAPAPFSHPDDLNAANTNILPVGDEVWALWEGGSPWRVDGETLETVGRARFDGELDGLIFSAHPKRDPNGDIWNFGGFGNRCVIWRLNASGVPQTVRPVELPASTLMHDFAITANHIVLLAPPLVETPRAATSLIDRFDWRGERPLLAIVLDKNDLSIKRVHELPGRFLYHIGNAWEDASGIIRIDACLAQDHRFAIDTARQLPRGVYREPPYAEPTLITLRADGRGELAGVGAMGEFPRVDPRRVGARHRFTWSVLAHGHARWDWDGGRAQVFDHGARYWPEEPIFVPDARSAREDDGWVLATRLDMSAGRTELLVFDARRLDAGPIALYACPYAVPLGFHGAFVSRRS